MAIRYWPRRAVRDGERKPGRISVSSTKPVPQTKPAERHRCEGSRAESPSGRTVPSHQNGSPHSAQASDGAPVDRDRSATRAIVQSLPAAFGLVMMLIYFVWVCLQMAAHALGGDALPLAIFGTVAAGMLAALAGLLRR